MPFTFAHPAAALPLRRVLGRFGVLSALVIGSLAPDFAYFLPLNLPREESHSLLALVWFCLPAGLFAYVLFHILLKGPLLGLLPPAALCRLGDYTARFRSLPQVSWTAVVVSLLCGAITHLLWDAFTHENGPAVVAIPILHSYLFSIGTYRVHVYNILQHGSTLAGLALLSVWSWRWLIQAPLRADPLPVELSSGLKVAVVVAIAVVPGVVGCWTGMQALGERTGMSALQIFAKKAIFTGMPVFGLAILVYGIGWHLWRLRTAPAG